jgi:hypothetical protein
VTGALHPAVQRLRFFSDLRWDLGRVNARRMELLRADPATAAWRQVLVIGDSGGAKTG